MLVALACVKYVLAASVFARYAALFKAVVEYTERSVVFTYPSIPAPAGIVTVPVNVGDASGAFVPSAVVIVVVQFEVFD